MKKNVPDDAIETEVAGMGQVVGFENMNVGRKNGGKHWTKEEVESRASAGQKLKRKKKASLKMPEWLEEEARVVWKKTIKDMKGFEILDKVDEDVLATYCDAVAKHKELTEQIREKGYTIANARGVLVEAPWVKLQINYARLIMQYADKLGLNANARARLAKKAADKEKGDPNGDLFD